jgi:hypothetical protein
MADTVEAVEPGSMIKIVAAPWDSVRMTDIFYFYNAAIEERRN